MGWVALMGWKTSFQKVLCNVKIVFFWVNGNPNHSKIGMVRVFVFFKALFLGGAILGGAEGPPRFFVLNLRKSRKQEEHYEIFEIVRGIIGPLSFSLLYFNAVLYGQRVCPG
jgi:hypothetical protein